MISLITAFVLGAASSLAVVYFLKKQILKVGDEVHLSLDAADLELIKAGKVCNARLSTIKELAEKAYGETGLSAIIHAKF